MKSASTSLYRYLAQHPQLFLPRLKEPNYFRLIGTPTDQILERTRRTSTLEREEYLALFREARSDQLIGDGSIQYLTSPVAIQAIAERAPEAKFLAILRQPAERAWSHYHYARELGRESVADFQLALSEDSRRGQANPTTPSGSYLEIGFYDQHLRSWQTRFRPEQFCFVLFDEFAADPQRELRRIYRFLGVDPAFEADTSNRYHVTGIARTRWLHRVLSAEPLRWHLGRRLPPRFVSWLGRILRRPVLSLPIDQRRELTERYRPDILALQERLGRDLGHWLE